MSPVDLRIEQDWEPVVEQAKLLIQKSKIHNSEIIPYGNATFYHIGPLGSVSHHHISKNWHNVVGPWTKKYLPWLEKMLDDMAELGPKYAISVMDGDGAEHIDFDDVPTALNYPIATTNAETYINYNGTEYCYPSIADQPWLLTTQYPHGVRNLEFRVVFNIHFEKTYPEVRQWFDNHPGLVYN